jgi:hypothetical protein
MLGNRSGTRLTANLLEQLALRPLLARLTLGTRESDVGLVIIKASPHPRPSPVVAANDEDLANKGS